MKANLLLNCSGLNPYLTSKQPRPNSVSSPCRCRVLATLLLCLTLGVGNAWGADPTVTYTQSSTSAIAVTAGTAPYGSSVTFATTYTDKNQLTNGKIQTLTLSGYNKVTISNITLSMKSNSSSGAGKLYYSTDNGTTWTYIVGTDKAGVAFNNSAWKGSWSTSYSNISKDVSISCSASNVIIKIEATASSIYCQSFKLTYSVPSYTVAWEANGTNWTGASHGSPSTSVSYNAQPSTLPTAPVSSDCDNSRVFVGWTNAAYSHASTAPTILFTSSGETPRITGNTTFYAVFANRSGSAPSNNSGPSYTRSSNADSYTSGYTFTSSNASTSTSYRAESGSAGSTTSLKVYHTSTAVFSSTPTSIKVTAKIGGGSGTTSLTYPVYAQLLDKSGNGIGTAVAITDYITSSSGDTYSDVNIPTAGITSAYGIMLYHVKQSGFNVRFYSFSFSYQTGGYTYSNYTTSCCTPLGSINGSVSLTNEDCGPGELKATWKMTATTGIASQTLKVYDENLDEVTAKRITGIDASTDNQTKTISGLDPCKEYMVTVENVSSGGEYCAAQDPWESDVVATLGYTITYNTTNISLSSGTEVANSCAADDIDVVYAANDGYHLPTSITVTNAGDEDDNWTWDAEDGEFIILDLSAVTGDVEVAISAELDACSDYGFYYGTTKGSENNYECFSQVGTSTTWLTELWTIPSADQWTYVGEPNWDADPGKSANLQLSSMPYALNHANNLGSISSGVMEGAQGYIKINDDSTDPNRYVGFIPAGYVFRWGSGESWTSYPFTGKTNAIEEEDWNTALQTWTSSNADDFTYVGLKTSSGYVWANRSETRRPVFLKPNDTWKGDNAKFVMYYWDASSHTGYSAIMTDPDGDGIYEAWIPNTYTYTNVIFGRLNPVQVDPVVNWDNKWNKTVDLTLPSDKNLFTITGGSDQSYTGSWSLYDKKGTFHISANSNTNNWYCHFLPHHVLTYNANGGSGAPDVQSVAINASPCQITVAAGSGMTPPTGYSFIGWNPDESEADAGNVDSDYDPNDTPTMSGDITLYAVWQANSIALTLDKNNSDASGSSNGSGSIDYDAASGTITTAATRTGYHVEGYYAEPGCTNKVLEDDGDVINSTVSGYTSSGKWARTTDPTTLYTKWTANEYTISLDDQSATTAASISSITVTFNANTNLTGTVVATRPTKTGYQFGGYYTGTSGSGVKVIDTDGTVVAGVLTYTDASKNWIKASDVDLYAYWLPIYAITWSVNGSALTGDALDGASTEVVSGGTISGVPSTAPADNTLNNCANKFMGWSRTNITKGSPVTDDDDIAALGLFTEASGYTTAISGATDFYAVFAESNSGTKSLTHDEITSFYCTGDACGGATNAYKNQTVSSSDGDWSGLCCSSLSSSVNYVNIKAELVNSARPYLQSPTYSGQITNIAIRATHGANSTRTLYICSSSEASPAANNIGTLSISKNNESIQNVVPSSSTDKIYLYSDGPIMIYSITVSYGSAENYVTQCADNQVRVTYNFNGGTGDACTEGVTTKSASYTVCSTEPEKDYYDFAGWNDGTSTYDAGATYNLQENTTFTAQWTATSYLITYNLNGGTQQVSPDPATSYTVESSDITLPTPTYGHKRFDGWYGNADLSTGGVQTTIAAGSHGNKEYWAKWTDRHTIVFDADGSETTIYRASDEALNASLAGQGSVPDAPDAPSTCKSKVFKGWTETEIYDFTNSAPADLMNTYTGTVSSDKHYYAVWATRSGSVGSYTYSEYSTTCCDAHVTLSSPSITGSGTVVFTPVSPAEASPDGTYATCRNDISVTATVTPASGYSCTALSFTRSDSEDVDIDPTISGNLPSAPSAQDFVLSFDKNTDVTVTTAATFTAKGVTGWTWKQATVEEQIDIPATVDLYIGQEAWFDLISFTPSDVISDYKGYTTTYNSDDLAQGGKGATRYKIRAKVAKSSMSLTLTSDNNGSVQEVITIRGTALPTATFVDNIHNKTDFTTGDAALPASGILSATIDGTDKRIVYLTQKTPNHADVAEPGSGNACEKSHLHLVGWIDKDWADEHPNATHSEILGAGTGVYYAANTDIDLSAKNGKTFLAVWSKIE